MESPSRRRPFPPNPPIRLKNDRIGRSLHHRLVFPNSKNSPSPPVSLFTNKPQKTLPPPIVVELLHHRRTPRPTQPALYFITSSSQSVQLIIDDFSMGKQVYESAYIYSVSEMQDHLVDKLRSAATRGTNRTSSWVKCVKELGVDFEGGFL